MNKNLLDYGLGSALPWNTQTAWGAKALWTRSPTNSFKILEGQQDSFGPGITKLKAWLNANLKEIRAEFSNLCQQGNLTLGGNQEVVLFEDSDYKIVASPLGSHSHIQLAAWKKLKTRWR